MPVMTSKNGTRAQHNQRGRQQCQDQSFHHLSPTEKGSASVSHTAPSLWTLPSPLSSFDASEQIAETRLKIGRLRWHGNQAKDCRQNAPVGIEPQGTKKSPSTLRLPQGFRAGSSWNSAL
jgi:hypothetical protein